MSKYRVWLLLILCNLFWAGNYVFGKFIVAEMSPLWITFSRWLVASFLLLITAQFFEKPDWKKISKAWPYLTILGVLGIIGYNLTLYSALDYTTPTNAALINTINPGIMALLSVLLLGEKISAIQISGIAVSLMGVLVVLTQGNLLQVFEVEYNRGDLLMLAALTIWTIYTILGKRLKSVPPITATAVSSLFATIIMAPFALAQGIDITNISSLAVTGILYMIIFPSVCSFIFWNISVREVGAGQAGIFINLIPVFTAAIGMFLGENVTIVQFCGGLLVFLGVYMTTGMLEKRFASYTKKLSANAGEF